MNRKVAIVTGGTRGIGAAVSRALSARGVAVVMNYVSREKEAEETLRAIRAAGGEACAVQADIGLEPEAARLFDEAEKRYGPAEILINSAGIILSTPIAEARLEDFERIFSVNVRGTFLMCRQAAGRFPERGRIVNFSSSVTKLLTPGYGLYCATKGAVEQLTRILARELGPRKITVNAVAPGPTDTELFASGKSPGDVARLEKVIGLGRIGKPEEVASLVAYLVSEDAAYITGQIIGVNGGMV